jgi:hypothetical protein
MRDDADMSDAISPGSLAAGPGFPRMALGLAWLGSSLAMSVLGMVVAGGPGQSFLGLAVLGIVATGAVVSNRHRRMTLTLSALASTVVVVVGLGTAALVAATSDYDAAKAVAIGAVPIVGGLLTERLSQRARRMAE